MNNTENEIMVGIDIGTTKVCVIVARMNEHSKLEILGKGEAKSEGITKGKVIHKEMTVKALNEAVAIAEKTSETEIDVVNIGIAGGHIESVLATGETTREDSNENGTFSLNDVNKLTEDVKRQFKQPGKEILHIVPQRYTVDDSDIKVDPVGCYGLQLKGEFHIITADKRQINILSDCLNAAGLKVNNVILEPFASALSVLSDEEKEQGVCLIDIGGGTTDLVIFKNGVMQHTYCIEAGGEILTRDIKEALCLTKGLAEKVKVMHGTVSPEYVSNNININVEVLPDRPPKSINKKTLAELIEARMTDIIDTVDSELRITNYIDNISAGIVITGGGSALKDIKCLINDITAVEVRLGSPERHLTGDTKYLSNPKYSTSIGLVMSCFDFLDQGKIEVNKSNTKEKKSSHSFKTHFENITATIKTIFNDTLIAKDENSL